MNGAASMDEEIFSVGKPIPRIRDAAPLEGRKVEVLWQEGARKVVDLAQPLAGKRAFAALRTDDTLFRTLAAGECGASIEWADGSDFPADRLDRLPEAGMSNAEFRDLMQRLGLSLDEAAATLEAPHDLIDGCSRSTTIPNHVALAMRYLAEWRTPAE